MKSRRPVLGMYRLKHRSPTNTFSLAGQQAGTEKMVPLAPVGTSSMTLYVKQQARILQVYMVSSYI